MYSFSCVLDFQKNHIQQLLRLSIFCCKQMVPSLSFYHCSGRCCQISQLKTVPILFKPCLYFSHTKIKKATSNDTVQDVLVFIASYPHPVNLWDETVCFVWCYNVCWDVIWIMILQTDVKCLVCMSLRLNDMLFETLYCCDLGQGSLEKEILWSQWDFLLILYF